MSASSTETPKRGGGLRQRAGLFLVVLSGALIACELLVRFAPSLLDVTKIEIQALRAELQGIPGSAHVATRRLVQPHPYTGYHCMDLASGSTVFPFVGAPFSLAKEPGVLRIACLGGSTTAGRWPAHLERILEDELGRELQVMNWGVPAWTTAQTLVNYYLNVQDWSPDIVLLHHAVNDAVPRSTPGFLPDYSHALRPWVDWQPWPSLRRLVEWSDLAAALALRGGSDKDVIAFVNRRVLGELDNFFPTLSAGTEGPFVRNTRSILAHATRRGARCAVLTMPADPTQPVPGTPLERAMLAGLIEHNELLRGLAAEADWLCIDLADRARDEPDALADEFTDLVHSTPEGQLVRARWVADALIDASWIEPGDQTR